eukprot:14107166-Ditylum_brightwellii.AAC.1
MFKNSVRWKEFWQLQALKQKETKDEDEDAESVVSDDIFSINEKGLSTGLSSMNSSKVAPPGLKALEDFLHQFKQTILEKIVTYKRDFQTQKDKNPVNCSRTLPKMKRWWLSLQTKPTATKYHCWRIINAGL